MCCIPRSTRTVPRKSADWKLIWDPPALRVDKTTNRRTISSPLMLDFRCWNCEVFLRSSSMDLPFRKGVFSFQKREIGEFLSRPSEIPLHYDHSFTAHAWKLTTHRRHGPSACYGYLRDLSLRIQNVNFVVCDLPDGNRDSEPSNKSKFPAHFLFWILGFQRAKNDTLMEWKGRIKLRLHLLFLLHKTYARTDIGH